MAKRNVQNVTGKRGTSVYSISCHYRETAALSLVNVRVLPRVIAVC